MNMARHSPHAALPECPSGIVHRIGLVPDAAPHSLAEVLPLLGVASEDWALACPVRQIRVRSGTLFCAEGSQARALHVVRHGSFKCLRYAEDGYEHVLGFAATGDVLGFEGLANGREPLGVVALEDASVFSLPLQELQDWRRTSPSLDLALQRILSAQLMRARDVATMMAAVNSEVRLARFLVWMSQQMAARGQSPRRLLLRMSRRDIASLLAIAHETVSRGFSQLAEWGYVKVDNRDVEILDMSGLKACTRNTRRDTEHLHQRPVCDSPLRARRHTLDQAGIAA